MNCWCAWKPPVIERGTQTVAGMRRRRAAPAEMLALIIDIVAPGTFPRTDFKARRVVDDREVFRRMSEKLAR